MNQIKIVLLILISTFAYSQKKNVGKVYSEHPYIETTNTFWEAYQNNDVEKINQLASDNFVYERNGERFNENSLSVFLGESSYVAQRFKNLTVKNANGWVSDAIDYKDGGVWVLSWKRWVGTDSITGLRINSFLHTQMRLDEKGKINFVNAYSDQSQFIKMWRSEGEKTNGITYSSHPAISSVRKVVSDYLDKDFEAVKSGFTENATFWNSTMESWDEKLSLDDRINQIKSEHNTYSEIYINEQGTPISLKYEGSEDMFVNSWWILYAKKGDKWFSVPFKVEHQVNSDGKIVSESLYYSSNRFE